MQLLYLLLFFAVLVGVAILTAKGPFPAAEDRQVLKS